MTAGISSVARLVADGSHHFTGGNGDGGLVAGYSNAWCCHVHGQVCVNVLTWSPESGTRSCAREPAMAKALHTSSSLGLLSLPMPALHPACNVSIYIY